MGRGKDLKMKMSIKSVVFALGFLLCSSAFGNEPLLWEIEGTGKVYLLGSTHVGRKEMYPLAESIIKAYDDADSLVLEADIDSENIRRHSYIGRFEKGKTLQDVLSYKKLWQLKEEMGEIGLDYEQNKTLKPWVIAIMITEKKISNIGYPPGFEIETYFYFKAKRDNKELEVLEGYKFLFELLDSLSKEEQMTFLQDSYKNINELEDDLEELFKSWDNGDVDRIYKLFMKEGAGFEVEDLMATLYGTRTLAMLDKMEGYLEEDKTRFVIVGGGHIMGDDGLLKMLATKGYKIKRFRN